LLDDSHSFRPPVLTYENWSAGTRQSPNPSLFPA
jgi:hypothetical protein